MRNSAFYRAVTLVSNVIGALPISIFAVDGDRMEKARNHPAWRLLRDSPNPARRQTPYEFKSYMQGRAMVTGNAYARIIRSGGRPVAMIQIDPSRVTIVERDDLSIVYRYQGGAGRALEFGIDEMLHLRSPWSRDGISGVGLLQVAAGAIDLARTAESATGNLLSKGAYVGGTLEAQAKLSPEAAHRLKEQFEARHAGPENAGRWMLLEEGLKATPFQLNGRDAEGLAQRKMQIEEIARFAGTPRPLLMMDETAWGSGIEQLGLYLVTYCLMPWFVSWEEALARALLNSAEMGRFAIKFNEGALLRGSAKDQAEFLAKALGGPGAAGWMQRNEARAKMNLNPVEGEDRFFDGSPPDPAKNQEKVSP